MNIYTISCYSKNSNIKKSYLQAITVAAKDKTSAIQYVKEWLKKKKKNFIYPEKDWKITTHYTRISEGAIIDVFEDNDF